MTYIPGDAVTQKVGSNKGIISISEQYDLVKQDEYPVLGDLVLIQTQEVSGVANVQFTDLKGGAIRNYNTLLTKKFAGPKVFFVFNFCKC